MRLLKKLDNTLDLLVFQETLLLDQCIFFQEVRNQEFHLQ